MSETVVYLELLAEVRKTRLAGEDGFLPLRAPVSAAYSPVTGVDQVEDGSEPLGPGERIIDGQRLYSARWL